MLSSKLSVVAEGENEEFSSGSVGSYSSFSRLDKPNEGIVYPHNVIVEENHEESFSVDSSRKFLQRPFTSPFIGKTTQELQKEPPSPSIVSLVFLLLNFTHSPIFFIDRAVRYKQFWLRCHEQASLGSLELLWAARYFWRLGTMLIRRLSKLSYNTLCLAPAMHPFRRRLRRSLLPEPCVHALAPKTTSMLQRLRTVLQKRHEAYQSPENNRSDNIDILLRRCFRLCVLPEAPGNRHQAIQLWKMELGGKDNRKEEVHWWRVRRESIIFSHRSCLSRSD